MEKWSELTEAQRAFALEVIRELASESNSEQRREVLLAAADELENPTWG